MSKYNKFTDNDLIYKENQISNWGERQKIGDELKWRGYEKEGSGWFKPDDSYEPPNQGSIFDFIAFIPIAMIVVLFAIIIVAPPAIYDLVAHQLPDFVVQEVKPVLNEYEGNIQLIQAGLPLIGVFFLTSFSGGFLLLLYLLTFTKVALSYFFKAQFLLFFLGSVFMAYKEWKIDDVQNTQLAIYVVVFLTILFFIFKVKKNWKIGLYTFLFSTIAFILSGTSLITPYMALSIAAASLVLFPGKFLERPRKRK